MKKKQKKVFITGAAGFVGANIVRRLIKENFDVHISLKESTDIWRLKDIISKIKLHRVSLLNKKDLEITLKKIKPNYIFHLAARGAYSTQNNLDEMINTNIIGTKNLLEASLPLDFEILISTGSSSEYGFKKHPMKETDYLEPISFYAATKSAQAYLCQVFAKLYNKPIITFRLFSVFGPWEEKTRFIPTVIKNSLDSNMVSITSGIVRRDFIYVEDVVDAFIAGANYKGPKKISGEIFNIGTEKQYTNQEVAAAINKICYKLYSVKGNLKKASFKKRYWDTDYWVADISKSKKILKWEPKFNLNDGLKENIIWLKNNSIFY